MDNLNDSLKDIASAHRLQQAVDEAFSRLGAKIKGWAISGQDPAPEISKDGLVGVAGNAWHPLTDTLELKLQFLHFGRIIRGRLAPSTKTFSGETTTDKDVVDFVPKSLTIRQITSKHMGVFDIKGLLILLTARYKRDLIDVFTETPKWDYSVSGGLRAKWVRSFLDIERCRGMEFNRPRMPIHAVDTKMRLWVLVDASKELLTVWSGVGLKRKNGSWSSAFLITRCLLVPTDCSIPRAEMEALVAGLNMLWLFRQILSNWLDTFILSGHAQIPLHWVLSDKLKFGLWH